MIRNLFLILAICTVFPDLGFAAVQEPVLTITSPSPNTIVPPGGTITVSVTTSIPLRSVMVIGEDFDDVQTTMSQPFAVTLNVPSEVLGIHKLTAVGIDTNGKPHFSAPVEVDIERDSIAGEVLTVEPSDIIHFHYIGDQAQVTFYVSANDEETEVTSSSNLIVTSQNDNIVTVKNDGLLVAVGQGETIVTAKYKNNSLAIRVSVPDVLQGDLNEDGLIDQQDLAILKLYLKRKAIVPEDARDLNHDGKITTKDVGLLKKLCTYPRCTTQP
jgi:hypothetical protein